MRTIRDGRWFDLAVYSARPGTPAATMEELSEVRELRKWQARELGPDFLRALQA